MPSARTAAAVAARVRRQAERAADDPVRLRRAVRIVLAAIDRGRLTLDDLALPSADGGPAASDAVVA